MRMFDISQRRRKVHNLRLAIALTITPGCVQHQSVSCAECTCLQETAFPLRVATIKLQCPVVCSPVLGRICEAHQRIPARLANDQVFLLYTSHQPPASRSPFAPFLSLCSVAASLSPVISPARAFLSFPTFFRITFPLAHKRCGWMPITLLSSR